MFRVDFRINECHTGVLSTTCDSPTDAISPSLVVTVWTSIRCTGVYKSQRLS